MTVHFSDFAMHPKLLAAVEGLGYTIPTPIQAAAIPPALEGKDILGIAQTGTGKTAAFLLPLIQHISAMESSPKPNQLRALILTPTRELAVQIADNLKSLTARTSFRHTTVFGGVSQKRQEDEMRRGQDIVIATPGRLLDLMEQKLVDLSALTHLVLDEADRMLDMGFITDVKKITAHMPAQRQTMFFSATMPQEVADLSNRMLKRPVRVEVSPVSSTSERIDQSVIFASPGEKRFVLEALLTGQGLLRSIVFTRTKHGANRVVMQLTKAGINCSAIHGGKSQNARQAALNDFKKGKIDVMIATDIAARGIDISDISHVINYDIPNEPESYVHRIGRTARAGKSGFALSLCARDEKAYLRQIERLTKVALTEVPMPKGTAELMAKHAALPKEEREAEKAAMRQERDPRDPRAAGGRASDRSGARGGRGGDRKPRSNDSSRGERSSFRTERPAFNDRDERPMASMSAPASERPARAEQPRFDKPRFEQGARPERRERPAFNDNRSERRDDRRDDRPQPANWQAKSGRQGTRDFNKRPGEGFSAPRNNEGRTYSGFGKRNEDGSPRSKEGAGAPRGNFGKPRNADGPSRPGSFGPKRAANGDAARPAFGGKPKSFGGAAKGGFGAKRTSRA